MLDPVSVLDTAISHAWFAKSSRMKTRPGQIVSGMSSEQREALSRLTSASIATIRADVVALHVDDYPWYGGTSFRKLKLDFDRKLKIPVYQPRWT